MSVGAAGRRASTGLRCWTRWLCSHCGRTERRRCDALFAALPILRLRDGCQAMPTVRPVIFTVPLPSRDLSPNGYKHWRKVSAARREYRAIVKLLASRVSRPETFDPVMVSLVFCLKGVRATGLYAVRDVPNAISAWKAGFDGLVDAGLFDDDSAKHMALGTVTIDNTRGPFVEVRLTSQEGV